MTDFNVCQKCGNMYVTTHCPCEPQRFNIKISDGTDPFIANPPLQGHTLIHNPVIAKPIPWNISPDHMSIKLTDEQMNDLATKVAEKISDMVLDRIVEKILFAEKKDD